MRGIERVLQADALVLADPVVDRLELGLHGIDRRQHIRARGAEHLQAKRRIAVLIGEALCLAAPDMDVRDVAQMDRLAAAPFEDQRFQRIDGIAAAKRQAILPAPDIDRPARDVLGAADLLRHLRNLDAELGGAQRIEDDVDLVGATIGIDLHRADAGDRLQPRDHDVLQKARIGVHIALVARQLLHEDVEQQ